MAVGDVKSTHTKRAVKLMEAQTANNAIPTAATDGVACYRTPTQIQFDAVDTGCFYVGRDARESTLMVYATANAAQVLVGTLTLWGYLEAANGGAGRWFEIPVNGGTAVTPVALAETDTDIISFQQRFLNLGHYDRLYLQLTGIGGTGASFEGWLVTGQSGTY